MKLIPCKEEESTHVRILEEDENNLIYGAIYKRYYDNDTSEQTHYVICEDESLYYDFECIVRVEYLKVVIENSDLKLTLIKDDIENNYSDYGDTDKFECMKEDIVHLVEYVEQLRGE